MLRINCRSFNKNQRPGGRSSEYPYCGKPRALGAMFTTTFMNEEIKKPIISKVNLLAYYQILGGIVGIILIALLIANVSNYTSLIIIMIFIASVLYSYSIACGIFLFKNVKRGLKYSIINQFLQIINFSLFGYGFKYISGLFFTIETDIARSFNFELKWGTSSWEFLFNNDNGEKVISINLVAIFLVVLIDKLIRKNASAVWPNKLTEIGPTP